MTNFNPTANISLDLDNVGLIDYLRTEYKADAFSDIYKRTYLTELIYKMLTIDPASKFCNVEMNDQKLPYCLFNTTSIKNEYITINIAGSIEECYPNYPIEATAFNATALKTFIASYNCSMNAMWLVEQLCRDYSIVLSKSYLLRSTESSVQWIIPINDTNTLDLTFSYTVDTEE